MSLLNDRFAALANIESDLRLRARSRPLLFRALVSPLAFILLSLILKIAELSPSDLLGLFGVQFSLSDTSHIHSEVSTRFSLLEFRCCFSDIHLDSVGVCSSAAAVVWRKLSGTEADSIPRIHSSSCPTDFFADDRKASGLNTGV